MLDEAARKRRQRKALEALEQDNFHDDPHADLGKYFYLIIIIVLKYHTKVIMSKKVPKFQESLEGRGASRRKKTRSAEYYKQRYRKTFAQLVEEDANNNPNPPNYSSAQAPPSKFPERHFCAVCGFPSNYTCIPCGARYCSVKCLGTHLDTRCLKWTA
ncbi:GSCOCG00004629001-RA-CDS [Cotesia congregata]|nr:GSCOCG00004629001-RA-CDS [Cotesia congregata]